MLYSREQSYKLTIVIVVIYLHYNTASIKLTALGYCDIGILKRIMIVPQMTINLISSSKLDLLGYAILIMNRQAKLVKGTQLIAIGHLINGLYHTKLSDFIPRVNATYIAQSSGKQVSSTRSRGVIRKNPVIQTLLETLNSCISELDMQV